MSYIKNRRVNSIVWRVLRKNQFDNIRPKLCHTLAFKIEGKTRRSNRDFSMLAFATKELATYISKISNIGVPEPMLFRRISFQQIPSVTASVKPDIAFVGASSVFSKFLVSIGFLLMPYINFSLDISDSWTLILNKMHRTKRKKIRRIEELGCTYEITKDMEKLKLFYYKMYVPRILSRHGKSAELVTFSECTRLFQKGGLLLVKFDGEYVSGAIYVNDDHTLYVPTLGISQDEDVIQDMGLLPLYFLARWGRKKGYNKIDYGSCQPFPRSGIFQFKKELGMGIQPICNSDSRIMAIKFCNFDKRTRDFILSNPCIFANKGKLRGLVIFDPKENLHNLYVPGLYALDILCPAKHVSELKQRYNVISKIDFDKSSPITSLLTMSRKESYETFTLRF